MEDFLARYGLLAVFAAAAVEGDVSVVLAGVLADLGFFSLPHAVEAAWLGGFVGDTAWYLLGRLNSAAVRRNRLYLRAAPLIERLVARVGEREIVLSRFVYGTRIASMFFWGVHGLPYGRFAAFDLVGCLLSAIALAGLGFGLSTSAVALVGRVKRAEVWLLVVLLASLPLLVAIRHVMRRVARER
ncbi:MAG TPA: VTT domain-containing protein [Verrucomicrobiae bacterium]|nr:VTT domain-containing protein [Verrucomicrobiae bacterium]